MLSKWGQRFSPLSLFAAGEQGGWWDPSDFSTLFQDSAGTTPVTAVGQPVGMIRDKSGRGNHRTQGTAASRPTLQKDASGYPYLSYDGVDDCNVTGNVDLTGTSKITALWGGMKTSDATSGIAFEIADPTTGVSLTWTAPRNPATANVGSTLRSPSGTNSDATYADPSVAAGVSMVAAILADTTAGTAAAQQVLRINGVQRATGSVLVASSAFPSLPINFGLRIGGTAPFAGREYQTIIRGAASTASQIAQAERFVGSRMGIAL